MVDTQQGMPGPKKNWDCVLGERQCRAAGNSCRSGDNSCSTPLSMKPKMRLYTGAGRSHDVGPECWSRREVPLGGRKRGRNKVKKRSIYKPHLGKNGGAGGRRKRGWRMEDGGERVEREKKSTEADGDDDGSGFRGRLN